MPRRALAALAASVLGIAGCAGAPRPLNVVLVLVDTLRADHLGLYGYARPTSPALDAFAEDAAVFTDARSQAGCTFPSVNSLLTSQLPERFLGQPDDAIGIPEGMATLPELLRARGWTTAAVSASSVVRRRPSEHNPRGGFGRGFDLFLEACEWKAAGCVNRQALPLLRSLRRPFFLYLHYLDPHAPYRPPRAHPRRFAHGWSDKRFIRRGDPNPIGRALYRGAPDPGISAADLRLLIDHYDEEIAYWDGELARLLETLAAAGLDDDTIVVVASDHGEEFLEHGHIKHCRTVFDSSIRVPLLLRAPGVAPARIAVGAQNLDVLPTLLDLLGLPAAGHTFAGRSLRPALESGDRLHRRQVSAQGAFHAVVGPRHKLIVDLAGGGAWLYDLAADPGETRDRLAVERRAAAPLRAALGEWLAAGPDGGTAGLLARSREAEERLRAVGYID
ncbi:MAG TPA: sulfatase [Thermoanaerobaculia bacterium]|nr:sulfatase [Thermoanaerobaculia bacterium]